MTQMGVVGTNVAFPRLPPPLGRMIFPKASGHASCTRKSKLETESRRSGRLTAAKVILCIATSEGKIPVAVLVAAIVDERGPKLVEFLPNLSEGLAQLPTRHDSTRCESNAIAVGGQPAPHNPGNRHTKCRLGRAAKIFGESVVGFGVKSTSQSSTQIYCYSN